MLKKTVFVFGMLFSAQLFGQTASDLLPVKVNKLWGVIDMKGQEIVPPKYEYVSNFTKHGFAAVSLGRKKGLLNAKGQEVLPCVYDDVLPLNQTLAAAKKGGLWGIVLVSGAEAAPFQYQSVSLWHEGLIEVSKGGKIGFLDGAAQTVSEPRFDFFGGFAGKGSVVGKVKIGKLAGLVNKQGKTVVEPIYDTLAFFKKTAKAYRQKAITEFTFDDAGELLSSKDFANEKAYEMTTEANRTELEIDDKIPGTNWVKQNGNWVLAEGKKILLDKDFYNISPDQETGLTLAQAVVKEEPKKETLKVDPYSADNEGNKQFKKPAEELKKTYFAYLVDHKAAKILFKIQAKDVIFTDFKDADYARASVDTLWDALVNKKGEMLRKVSGGGKDFPITNMGNYSGGLAWIQSGAAYGFLDKTGNIAVPIQYDLASDFSDGFAVVGKNKKFGAVNNLGKEVIPTIMDGISTYSGGVFRVKKGVGKTGKWGCADATGKEKVPYEYDYIGEFKNGQAKSILKGKLGILSPEGKIIMPFVVQAADMGELQNGLAPIFTEPYQEDRAGQKQLRYKKMGFVNAKGEVVVPADYERVEGFMEAYSKQKGVAKVWKGMKIGYINYKGEVAMPPLYSSVDSFEYIWGLNEGVARVQLDGKFGYIDYKGDQLIAPIYSFLGDYKRANAAKKGWVKGAKEGKYGYLDHQAKEVIAFKYEFLSDFSNGVALAKYSGKWGTINEKGETLLPFEHDGLKFLEASDDRLIQVLSKKKRQYLLDPKGGIAFSGEFEDIGNLSEGLIAARKNGKWGFVDAQGAWKIEPQFEGAGDFSEGLAAVQQGAKWGYVDASGSITIAPAYMEAGSFASGAAKVLVADKKTTFIDKAGKQLLPPDNYLSAGFNGGAAAVSLNGKHGLLGPDGEWRLPTEYAFVGEITDGVCVVESDKDKTFALCSVTGKFLTKFDYVQMGKVSEGMIAAKNDDKDREKKKFGYLNLKGQTAVPHTFSAANDFKDGLALVNVAGKWGYIEAAGKFTLPAQFRSASDFSGGLAVVDGNKIIDKTGKAIGTVGVAGTLGGFSEGIAVVEGSEGAQHISSDGNPIYPYWYDDASAFVNGWAFVKKGEKWSLTREIEDRKVQVPFPTPLMKSYIAQYGKTRSYKDPKGRTIFDRSWALAEEGKWRMLNADGKFTSKVIYDKVEFLKGGYIKITVPDLEGVADLKGALIAAPVYEEIRLVNEGKALRLDTVDQVGYIDLNGVWVWKPKG